MTIKQKVLYTPQEVHQMMLQKSVVILDVRDPEFYQEEHIPGAINVPDIFYYLSKSTPDGIRDLQHKFSKIFSQAGVSGNEQVIVYEESMDSRYGSSCRGYWLLSYLGHTNAGVLNGGFMAWAAEGLPVETGHVISVPVEFNLTPQAELLATQGDVLAALDDPLVVLLDDRDKVEWNGDSSSPYGVDFAPRKGRLPGAKWVEWYNFMEQTLPITKFKSGKEIRILCNQHNLHPDNDIIIYCFKGARASNTFVALKEAGFKKLRIYFGSWNEWSRDPQLPIDQS